MSIGRATAAELAAARKRPPFQPAQQLLDIEARERAVRPGQAGRPVEGLRHREHAVAAAFDHERNIAFAFEPTQTEQLAEAAFEVDIGEIQLRFDVDPLLEIGERHGALDHSAIGLCLADGQHQMAVTQVCRDCGASELGIRHDDSSPPTDARSRSSPARPSSVMRPLFHARSLAAIRRTVET